MLGLDQVGKTYPNRVHALDAVSLTVEPGAIVAVVGGSGCGKSTLLRLVSGLDQPTEGTIRLDGTVIRAPHPRIALSFRSRGYCPGCRLRPMLALACATGRPPNERGACAAR